jgi:hypothetical protein
MHRCIAAFQPAATRHSSRRDAAFKIAAVRQSRL